MLPVASQMLADHPSLTPAPQDGPDPPRDRAVFTGERGGGLGFGPSSLVPDCRLWWLPQVKDMTQTRADTGACSFRLITWRCPSSWALAAWCVGVVHLEEHPGMCYLAQKAPQPPQFPCPPTADSRGPGLATCLLPEQESFGSPRGLSASKPPSGSCLLWIPLSGRDRRGNSTAPRWGAGPWGSHRPAQ